MAVAASIGVLAVAAFAKADEESIDLKGWVTAQKGCVHLMADPALREDAERYATIASDALEYARSQWGAEMDETTAMVYLPATREDFLGTARGHEEDLEFAGGYAIMAEYPTAAYVSLLPRGVTDPMAEFMKGPGGSLLLPTAVIDGSLPAGFIPSALRHEMTHLAMFKAIGLKVAYVPLWFQQGVATYYQYGESETAKLAESYAGYPDGVPAFESIRDDTAHESADTGLACVYAADLTSYCERACGPKWVGRILTQIKDGGAFEVAIEDASGMPLDDLIAAWHADLAERAARRNLRNGILAAAIVLGVILTVTFLTWLVSRKSSRPPDDGSEPPQSPRTGIATIS